MHYGVSRHAFRIFSNLGTSTLVLVFVFSVALIFMGAPHRVQAQTQALLVPTNDVVNNAKETGFFGLSFDGLAFEAANILIDQIGADIVTWINTGFDGNPAFVDDLGAFSENVADKITGQFFENNNLNWMCSPFKIEVQLALLEDYNNNNLRFACTLSGAVENVEDFFDGNFASGGWETWFEVTQRRENSPYGAYLASKEALEEKVASAIGKEDAKLGFGNGFFTKEQCSIYTLCESWVEIDGFGEVCESWQKITKDEITEEQLAAKGTSCLQTETLTPGKVIEDRLNETLGSGQRRIEVADELSEIFTALIHQLLTQVLTDEGGLRGATEFIEEVGIGTVIGGPTGSLDCNGGSPGSSTITKTVDSFEITQGNKEKIIGLGLNGHYPHMSASFDFFLGPDLNSNGHDNWQAIYLLRPTQTQSGVGGWFNHLTIMQGASIMNMIGNGLTKDDDWTNVNANWTLNHWYHIEMTYDAGVEARIVVTDRDSGNTVATMSATPANSIYSPSGGGTKLFLGSETKPLIGSIIEDFTLTLVPGEAVCGGVPAGGGSGGGGPINP